MFKRENEGDGQGLSPPPLLLLFFFKAIQWPLKMVSKINELWGQSVLEKLNMIEALSNTLVL